MMRSLGCLGAMTALLFSAGTAWGQFGLYGAPEVLRLPTTQSELLPPQYYTGPNTADSPHPGVQPQYVSPVGQMLRSAAPAEAPSVDPAAYGTLESSTTWESRGTGGCLPEPCCAPEACCETETCDVCCECPWYGSVNWLVMSRDKSNHIWTTYEWDEEPNQLMHTWDMDMKWSHGGEVRFGRRFCCGATSLAIPSGGCNPCDVGTSCDIRGQQDCGSQWALEGVYWTLDAMDGMCSMTHPNDVSTPLDVAGIEFDSTNGTFYFDHVREHRIWRRNEFHNVEINLVRYAAAYDPCSPWDVHWLCGVRYFRFSENLLFGSRRGATWGAAGGENEAYLGDDIRNNLIGGQLGCDVKHRFAGNWAVFLSPKVGIYNNHISHVFRAYRGDGVAAVPTAASEMTGTYPVHGSGNFLSFLGEANVGIDWQFHPNWSAQIGYRVIAATGIGLADHQIPHYIVDIPEIMAIDHNGNLLVHGGFAGVNFNF